MGSGSTDSYRVEERTEARQQIPTQQVFKQEEACCIHPGMDPMGLVVRESRDIPVEHDESIGVIFKMDITGSMGSIPVELAKKTMHEFMPALARVNPHVQVCFGAVGDPFDGGEAPWQIGQFETSDELADEWLTRLWTGGSGGGAPYEAYDLAFYFAGYLTSIDCWEKRKKKGYLFITGDDICRPSVCAAHVNALLGRTELQKDMPIQTVIAKAAEMYHIFFLIPDAGRERNYRGGAFVGDHWRGLLGENGTVVVLDNSTDIAVGSSTLFALTEGAYASLNALKADLLAGFTAKRQAPYLKAKAALDAKTLEVEAARDAYTARQDEYDAYWKDANDGTDVPENLPKREQLRDEGEALRLLANEMTALDREAQRLRRQYSENHTREDTERAARVTHAVADYATSIGIPAN